MENRKNISSPGKYMAHKNKSSFKQKFHKFTRKIKTNRLYQFLLFFFIGFIIFSSGRLNQASKDKTYYNNLLASQKEEIIAEYENQISDLQTAQEQAIQNLREEYENLTPEEVIQKEAEYIAKVLYGTAKNNSERDQRTVVWCILNRVDNSAYPNTIQEVCEQASQWMGYSTDNPILNELYQIALTELQTWHNNYRPVSSDYIYMSWSSQNIVLRDTYEKKDNTRYWQAG